MPTISLKNLVKGRILKTNRMFLIYCFTNKINGKKYIGITSRSLKERKNQHIREAYERDNYKTYNSPFKRAIRKYGIENFEEVVLEDNLTKEQAIEKEIYYIKEYKTYYKYLNSNGYNATIGGDLIICPKDKVLKIDPISLEIIEVYDSISSAERICGGSVFEAVHDQSKTSNGYIWMYEKDFNKKDKESLYNSIHCLLNHIVQLDFNKNLIQIWKGSKFVLKELGYNQGNISACCRGKRYHSNGYRWMFFSDWINNIDRYEKKNTNKKVIQLDMENNEIKIFNSLTEASMETRINISNISTVCRGRAISAGGFKWKYYNEGGKNELS